MHCCWWVTKNSFFFSDTFCSSFFVNSSFSFALTEAEFTTFQQFINSQRVIKNFEKFQDRPRSKLLFFLQRRILCAVGEKKIILMKRKLSVSSTVSEEQNIKVRKTEEPIEYAIELCGVYFPPEVFQIILSNLRNNPFYFRLQQVSKSWKHYIQQHCLEEKHIDLLHIFCHGAFTLTGKHQPTSFETYKLATASFLQLYRNATSMRVFLPYSWYFAFLWPHHYPEEKVFLSKFMEWFSSSSVGQSSAIEELTISYLPLALVQSEFHRNSTIDLSKTRISKVNVFFEQDVDFWNHLIVMGKTLPDFSVICTTGERVSRFVNQTDPKMKQYQVCLLKEALRCGVPIQKIVSASEIHDPFRFIIGKRNLL